MEKGLMFLRHYEYETVITSLSATEANTDRTRFGNATPFSVTEANIIASVSIFPRLFNSYGFQNLLLWDSSMYFQKLKNRVALSNRVWSARDLIVK
jgi:hypothetical protein